ncbi:hypothetical protein V8G54_013787 [Vigna mungo]|uniref:Uncharacterized protein n=1 Tax=Vigna mungo TaxID=3915 RepID=A0AAQ3RWV8_VIGMU
MKTNNKLELIRAPEKYTWRTKGNTEFYMSFKLHDQMGYTKKQCTTTLGNNVYLGPHNLNGYIIRLRCRNLRQDHMTMSEKPGPFRGREQYQLCAVNLAGKAARDPPPCPHSFLGIANHSVCHRR